MWNARANLFFFLISKKKLNKLIEKWVRPQFLKCVLVTPGVPKTISGGL